LRAEDEETGGGVATANPKLRPDEAESSVPRELQVSHRDSIVVNGEGEENVVKLPWRQWGGDSITFQEA